ncbi:hypothetical protein GLOIN_2v618094 [Rhizophagus clarus]|uniref:Uncharacterized protein n=1 Tax=Rhizophagus clarus TaxID=94130 RepID=A0A8H3QU65_9GLOM|nr:hypothetical protein GLOIN_2v618094 [Rhizophagus clarus]
MQNISYYFNKFKQSFQEYLSNLSLEFLFCAIIYANVLVTLTGGIFIWVKPADDDKMRSLNFEIEWFLMSILTIISGIVTAILRTHNHIIIYFITNIVFTPFICYEYYKYYDGYGSIAIGCYDVDLFCILRGIPGLKVLIGLHITFLLFIILIAIIRWRRERKRVFEIANYNKLKKPKIQKIYRRYYIQQILCHTQIITAMLSQFTYFDLMDDILSDTILRYVLSPNVLLCLIAVTMIKGVREESKRVMCAFYISSFIFYGYIIFVLILALIGLISQEEYHMTRSEINLVFSIISFLLTTITLINSIICHKNFGNGLKDYLLSDDLQHFMELIDYKDDIDDCYS